MGQAESFEMLLHLHFLLKVGKTEDICNTDIQLSSDQNNGFCYILCVDIRVIKPLLKMIPVK